MKRIYREGDDLQELVDDIEQQRERDHDHSLKQPETPKSLPQLWHEFEQLFVPEKPSPSPQDTTILGMGFLRRARQTKHAGQAKTPKGSALQLTPVLTSESLLPQKYNPSKPVMHIYPIDRSFVECYITKAYGALVSAGHSKNAAKDKTWQWQAMQNPRLTLEDILRYLDIEMIDAVPFRYFAK